MEKLEIGWKERMGDDSKGGERKNGGKEYKNRTEEEIRETE